MSTDKTLLTSYIDGWGGYLDRSSVDHLSVGEMKGNYMYLIRNLKAEVVGIANLEGAEMFMGNPMYKVVAIGSKKKEIFNKAIKQAYGRNK